MTNAKKVNAHVSIPYPPDPVDFARDYGYDVAVSWSLAASNWTDHGAELLNRKEQVGSGLTGRKALNWLIIWGLKVERAEVGEPEGVDVAEGTEDAEDVEDAEETEAE
jgi:hypothetical protein